MRHFILDGFCGRPVFARRQVRMLNEMVTFVHAAELSSIAAAALNWARLTWLRSTHAGEISPRRRQNFHARRMSTCGRSSPTDRSRSAASCLAAGRRGILIRSISVNDAMLANNLLTNIASHGVALVHSAPGAYGLAESRPWRPRGLGCSWTSPLCSRCVWSTWQKADER